MLKPIQNFVVKILLKGCFLPIKQDDLLVIKKREIYYKGIKLNEKEKKELKESFLMWEKSDVWKLLNETAQYFAQKRIVEKASNHEETMFGRGALWALQTQQALVDSICKWD